MLALVEPCGCLGLSGRARLILAEPSGCLSLSGRAMLVWESHVGSG